MNNLFVYGSKTVSFTYMLNERSYTALIAEIIFDNIIFVTSVSKSNGKTCIKESRFTKMISESFIIIFCCFLKNKSIRLEFNEGTGNIRITDNRKVRAGTEYLLPKK